VQGRAIRFSQTRAAQAVWEKLIEAVRPQEGAAEELRRTVSAIFQRL
jgi:hypothetical protein